jgi:hypothetical protein
VVVWCTGENDESIIVQENTIASSTIYRHICTFNSTACFTISSRHSILIAEKPAARAFVATSPWTPKFNFNLDTLNRDS